MTDNTTGRSPLGYRTSKEAEILFAALNLAQAEATNASVNQENAFFNSGYADLPSYLDAVNPPLHRHGFSILQGATSLHELPGGLVYATVSTRLAHTSGQWIEWLTDMPIAKLDSHGAASAQTYARRNSLAGGMAIFHGMDDDGNAASLQQRPPNRPTRLSDLRRLHGATAKANADYLLSPAGKRITELLSKPSTTTDSSVELAVKHLEGLSIQEPKEKADEPTED
jgi:hypothetical protein